MLCFIALRRYCIFYRLRARPSTSNKIPPHFIVMLALLSGLEPNLQYLWSMPLLQTSSDHPTPRQSLRDVFLLRTFHFYVVTSSHLFCVRVDFFVCLLYLSGVSALVSPEDSNTSTTDLWTTQVWTVWVHLHMVTFNIYVLNMYFRFHRVFWTLSLL